MVIESRSALISKRNRYDIASVTLNPLIKPFNNRKTSEKVVLIKLT